MELLEFLNNRLKQLKDRRAMIPKYVERPGSFLGKKDFSKEDIPLIDFQIRETVAAITAVKSFHQVNRKPKK